MAGTLMIDSVTFGDATHAGDGNQYVRTYTVSDRVIALFNAWRYNLEPDEFVAGLIADAMDDEDGVERDAAWTALRNWMRDVFLNGSATRWYGDGNSTWKRAFLAVTPPSPAEPR